MKKWQILLLSALWMLLYIGANGELEAQSSVVLHALGLSGAGLYWGNGAVLLLTGLTGGAYIVGYLWLRSHLRGPAAAARLVSWVLFVLPALWALAQPLVPIAIPSWLTQLLGFYGQDSAIVVCAAGSLVTLSHSRNRAWRVSQSQSL